MNKEKLIYDAILKKAHGVNRTTRPAHGQGQYDMAYEILNMVEEIINTQPVNNNWIPCSDKLPVDLENYLVTLEDEYGELYISIVEYGKYTWTNKPPYSDVIAWQPLPQPYKGE